ncbi:MAG TPA: LPXTG cell wall anchor domain-containing protein [Acidimicrobiia bacterium]|nr:LPXTG cell wall anchor domain-containing protein [Acidimicrobiia bacterium]
MGLIIFLLIVWLVISVLGVVLEGLFWLTVIGLILLVGTAIWGWTKRNTEIGA